MTSFNPVPHYLNNTDQIDNASAVLLTHVQGALNHLEISLNIVHVVNIVHIVQTVNLGNLVFDISRLLSGFHTVSCCHPERSTSSRYGGVGGQV